MEFLVGIFVATIGWLLLDLATEGEGMIDPRIPQNVVDLWGKVLAARSVVSGLESDVTAAQAAVTKAQDALALAQAALAQGRVPLDDAYKALRAAEDAMFVGPLKATTPNLGASPFK